MNFKLHDKGTAPADSQALLENSVATFGMIPNLHAVMAEAPALLEGYQQLHRLFQQTSFDADELTVIWQTTNIEHDCHYCIPAHTAVAHMMKVDATIIDALRNRTEMPTEKLQALHLTTLALVRKRGILDDTDLARFYNAGYQKRQLLEIIVGIAQKLMSNYTNHLAQTPVDEAFQKFS